MSGALSLAAADFSTPQSEQNNQPNTLASAATIAPIHMLTRITGTTPITTITPPQLGFHILWFVFSSAFATAFNVGGNIATAYTSIVDRPIALLYDPRTKLYYVMAVA